MKNFLSSSWQEADAYLLACRNRLNETLPAADKIGDNQIVLLVALEGAADHKKHHRYCLPAHYTDFAQKCREYMASYQGQVLPPHLDGEVDYMACGWFLESSAAVTAVGRIHRHFLVENLQKRPVWVHEKHTLAAIGRNEYAAFRLLQMAGSDQTLVDPVVWEGLPKVFRELAQTINITLPDFDSEARETEQKVRENVAAFYSAYQRRIHQAKVELAREASELVNVS